MLDITTKLPELSEYLEDDTVLRVYIGFSSSTTWLRSVIVRLGIMLYTGDWTWPKWTHAYVMIHNLDTDELRFYEMDDRDGMLLTSVEVSACLFNKSTSELSFRVDTFYGTQNLTTLPALDVTSCVLSDCTDIDYNWYQYYTDTKMSVWTAARHLTKAKDKVTWTCSGLTQALLGWYAETAYKNPRTPDQLYAYYTITPASSKE